MLRELVRKGRKATAVEISLKGGVKHVKTMQFKCIIHTCAMQAIY